MAIPYQQTVRYRTYIKETMVESLRNVFVNHPDPLLKHTKVTPELPTDAASFPSIIVRYYNRSLHNAGVGHHEWFKVTPEGYEPKLFQKFKHFMYSGDIEFKILALSSKDREFLADALVQIIGMAEAEDYTEAFLERIYDANQTAEPQSLYHFINISTDDFQELGDQEAPAPWLEEDLLVYSSTFRVPVFGEFYSRLLTDQTSYGFVEKVEVYPWIQDLEDEPNPNPEDPSPWLSSGDVSLE